MIVDLNQVEDLEKAMTGREVHGDVVREAILGCVREE